MIPAATINSHLSLLSDRGVGSIQIDRYYPKESMVGSRSAAMVQREKMANLLDNPTHRVKRARSLCRAKNDLPGKLLIKKLSFVETCRRHPPRCQKMKIITARQIWYPSDKGPYMTGLNHTHVCNVGTKRQGQRTLKSLTSDRGLLSFGSCCVLLLHNSMMRAA